MSNDRGKSRVSGCLLVPVLFVVALFVVAALNYLDPPNRPVVQAHQIAVATAEPSAPVSTPPLMIALPDATPVPRAVLVKTSPTPDPWNNPEFKNLTKPMTVAQKKQEKEEAKHWHGVPEGTVYGDTALDAPGYKPFEWTQIAIRQAAGVSGLIDPTVTYGPYATTFDGKRCFVCKVTFRVAGDNRQHCAVVYERPVAGPDHVIYCSVDF